MTEPEPVAKGAGLERFISRFAGPLPTFIIFSILAFLAFHRALSLGFLCDDTAALITRTIFSWRPKPGTFQYIPIPFALNYGFYQLFHLNPLPYHIFQLLLVVLAAVLVKILASDLGFDPLTSLVAGLLTLFNSVASEAYFWYTGSVTVMMAITVLLGLICLARFRRTGDRVWAWAYLGVVFLAPFMESKGMILAALGYLLDRYLNLRPDDSWKDQILAGWQLHLTAFALVAVLALFRLAVGVRLLVINLPWAEKLKTFWVTLVSTLSHGFDDYLAAWLGNFPLLWGFIAVTLGIFLLALLVLGWFSHGKGVDRRRFLILICLWLLAILPHSLAAMVQIRYFYLPGVFAALVLADLFRSLAVRIAPRHAASVVVLALLSFLAMDLRAFQLSLNSFQEASRIYDRGFQKLRQDLVRLAPCKNLVLLDFPDLIYSQQGRGWHRHKYYIYIFRTALEIDLLPLCPTVKIYHSSHSQGQDYLPLGEAIGADRLAELLAAPLTPAYRYVPGSPPGFINLKQPGTLPAPAPARP